MDHLILGGGGILQGTGTLQIVETMTWSGGTMKGTGTTLIGPDAVLTIPDNYSFLNLQDGRTLRNEGTVEWEGGNSISTWSGTARYENAAGAVWNMGGNGTLSAMAGSGVVFENEGLLAKTGTLGMMGDATVFMGVTLETTGAVTVATGTLRLAGGGEWDGLISLAEGSSLELAEGELVAFAAAQADGPGVVIVGRGGNATLSIDPGMTSRVANLELRSGGVIGGAGTLVVSGTLIWKGGRMEDSGVTRVEADASLFLDPTGSGTLMQRWLENRGLLQVQNAGLVIGDGGRILNSGTMKLIGTVNISAGPGLPGRLVNTGTLQQLFTTQFQTGTIDIEVHNAHRLEVLSGTLVLRKLLHQEPALQPEVAISEDALLRVRDFVFTSGLVTGLGDLEVTGEMVWTQGGMRDPGETRFGLDAIVVIQGNAETADRTILNQGLVTLAGGNLRIGSTFTNENRFQILGDFDVNRDTTFLPLLTPTFVNRGLFRKVVGGAEGTVVRTKFNNLAGSVDLLAGELHFGWDGVYAAPFNTAPGTSLWITKAAFSAIHIFQPGAAINGEGQVYFHNLDVTSLDPSRVSIAAGVNLRIQNLIVDQYSGIVNAGTLSVRRLQWDSGRMQGGGVLVIGQGDEMEINGALDLIDVRIFNSGIVRWNGERDIRVLDDVHIIQDGNIGEGLFEVWNGQRIIESPALNFQIINPRPSSLRVQSGGAFKKMEGGPTTVSIPAENNNGTVSLQAPWQRLDFMEGYHQSNGNTNVGGGTIQVTGDYRQEGGTTSLAGGALNAANVILTGGSTMNLGGGTLNTGSGQIDLHWGAILSGAGMVIGNVWNNGRLEVGGLGVAGFLTISGNYTQTVVGRMAIDLGGSNPITGYDRVNITGDVDLLGALEITLVNDFQPTLGLDTFLFLLYQGQRNGQFQNLVLIPPADGLQWGLDYNTNHQVTMSV